WRAGRIWIRGRGNRPAAGRRATSPPERRPPPRSRRVHLVDQLAEHALHGVALHLLGGGELAVFVIELLGEQSELADVLHSAELLIRFLHDTLDDLDHLELLREIAVCRVENPPSRRPVADRVELDPY